ncbi:MAG: hypothetical protein MIO92_14415 [Methanosarcinaceae archaeon]|nr:hypothetical protein [Methanosarcinaceae archaeon]
MSDNSVEKSVEELLISSDVNERNKGLEIAGRMENGTYEEDTEAIPEVVDGIETTNSEAEIIPETIKKVLINYRGQTIEKEDTDGFLGRKSIEGLKMAKAHSDAHIEFIETELAKERREAAELRSKLEAANSIAKPAHVAPAPTEKPTRPTKPQLSNTDPSYWTPEEAQEMNNYWDASDKYMQYLDNKNDPRYDDLESRLKKYESQANDYTKTTESAKAAEANTKYWNSIEKFRDDHPEFKTIKTSIADLNQQVDKWGETLAIAAGHNLPRNVNEQDDFENTKINLMNQFVAGNASVLQYGVTPPKGYEEVFKIAQLDRERERLIKEDVLGKNATLHKTWLYLQDENGTLDKGFSEIEKEARQRGAASVFSVGANHEANHAVTLPDNAPPKTDDPFESMSVEEMEKLLTTSPNELALNPDLRAKQQMLLKRLQ